MPEDVPPVEFDVPPDTDEPPLPDDDEPDPDDELPLLEFEPLPDEDDEEVGVVGVVAEVDTELEPVLTLVPGIVSAGAPLVESEDLLFDPQAAKVNAATIAVAPAAIARGRGAMSIIRPKPVDADER